MSYQTNSRFDSAAAYVGATFLVFLGLISLLVARHDCYPGSYVLMSGINVNASDMWVALSWLHRAILAVVVITAILFAIPFTRRVLLSCYSVFLFPVVSSFSFLWFKHDTGFTNSWYLCIVNEDSVVENATAIFFVAASPLSATVSRRLFRRGIWPAAIFHLGIAALTLFMGLEEISYGQRIFGFSTPPELAAVNSQQELNLHNISSLEWLSDNVAPQVIMKWGLYGWLIAAVAGWTAWLSDRWRLSIRLAFPPWFVASYFIPYQMWDYSFGYPWIWPSVVWQDQEICEMFLGLAFLAFSCYCFREVVRSSVYPEKPGVRTVDDGRPTSSPEQSAPPSSSPHSQS